MIPFTGQGAYVLWVVGLFVICLTLVQSARTSGTKVRFPQLTGPRVSTMVAWLLISILAVFAAARIR